MDRDSGTLIAGPQARQQLGILEGPRSRSLFHFSLHAALRVANLSVPNAEVQFGLLTSLGQRHAFARAVRRYGVISSSTS
jgi:hypothetical protein